MLTLDALQLAMGVLATIFGGSAVALRGGNTAAPKAPPLNASSSDEADFIKYFEPCPTLESLDQRMLTPLAGSLWRRLRQRRSLRLSTRMCCAHIDGSAFAGFDCTTIDRTDTRSMKRRLHDELDLLRAAGILRHD